MFEKTPLIYSSRLSKISGCSVYLKLEADGETIPQNLQPGHSFKSRGITRFIRNAIEKHGPQVHLIVASSGNAGYAAACAARNLRLRCTVFIPEGVPQRAIDLLKDQEAEVTVRGKIYLETLDAAKEAAKGNNKAVLVPSYDDPLIWDGHASMITEISSDLKKPDAIFLSVGGGGMLGGVMTGCKNVGWDDVPIIGLETISCNCFHHSFLLNTGASSDFVTTLPPSVTKVRDENENLEMVHFHEFSSKASGSLGASRPSARVLKMALERPGLIKCVSVQDELSMSAGIRFAEDHKMMVELACSTTLVPAYNRELLDRLGSTQARPHSGVYHLRRFQNFVD
ncbi:catabolic L-serine/threonine dehydratase [Paramarasmius palmivorus]|uniref:L-serine ammonia-lyase n=1 Tax=Paramarasmius palmivorus TaxID=297713 RepID=A0AAW0CR23_9AGAR